MKDREAGPEESDVLPFSEGQADKECSFWFSDFKRVVTGMRLATMELSDSALEHGPALAAGALSEMLSTFCLKGLEQKEIEESRGALQPETP